MGIRWLKMDKMSDNMKRHRDKIRNTKDVLGVFTTFRRYGSGEPANNPARRGPRWPQEGPSWPQKAPWPTGLLARQPASYLPKVVKTLGTSCIFRIWPLCRLIVSLKMR